MFSLTRTLLARREYRAVTGSSNFFAVIGIVSTLRSQGRIFRNSLEPKTTNNESCPHRNVGVRLSGECGLVGNACARGSSRGAPESGDEGCSQGRHGIRFNDGGSGPRAARRLDQGRVRYQEERGDADGG